MKARERLKLILLNIKDRLVGPGDIASAAGLPRYEVLAAFHVLEALNIIEPVHIKGNFKIYRLTEAGEELLKALTEGKEIMINVAKTEKRITEVAS